MKRIVSLVLSVILLCSTFTVIGMRKTIAAEETEPRIVYTINAAELCKGTYGENTTKLETEEENGAKVLKVTPNNIDPGAAEIVLDFYNLNIPAVDLKDARYLAVKYRYECPPGKRNSGDKMAIGMMPSGGALNAWVH